MHEGHDPATGAGEVLHKAFVANEMNFLVPVLGVGYFDSAHLTGRDAIRTRGSLCTRGVDLRLKCLECSTGKIPELLVSGYEGRLPR
jgi:hypothetical protein